MQPSFAAFLPFLCRQSSYLPRQSIANSLWRLASLPCVTGCFQIPLTQSSPLSCANLGWVGTHLPRQILFLPLEMLALLRLPYESQRGTLLAAPKVLQLLAARHQAIDMSTPIISFRSLPSNLRYPPLQPHRPGPQLHFQLGGFPERNDPAHRRCMN